MLHVEASSTRDEKNLRVCGKLSGEEFRVHLTLEADEHDLSGVRLDPFKGSLVLRQPLQGRCIVHKDHPSSSLQYFFAITHSDFAQLLQDGRWAQACVVTK